MEIVTSQPNTIAAGWVERAVGDERRRLHVSAALLDSAFLIVQDPWPRRRSWIGRHPVLFGTLVGFGDGFLIGYAAGDSGVFDDFTAGFNGVLSLNADGKLAMTRVTLRPGVMFSVEKRP